MPEHNELAVIHFKYLLDNLTASYKTEDDLEYLKETLRQIRSLVHQANLDTDQLIANKAWSTGDFSHITETLKSTFPTLAWEMTRGTILHNLIVTWEGKNSGLYIEVELNNKKEYYTIDVGFSYDNDSCFGPYAGGKYSTLEEAINKIKELIIPLQNSLSQLKIN